MTVLKHSHEGQLIQYELKRTRRKTLGIYIYPDRRVQLRVPHKAGPYVIEQYLNKSAAWIVSQLDQLPPEKVKTSPQLKNGELHYFRGKPYPLFIHQGRPQRVEFEDGCLRLYSMDVNDEERCRLILKAWYKQQAQGVFAQRLNDCWQQMERLNLAQPILRLRWMKARWGSCSSKAVITLNIELMKHPEEHLDYVVMHELCHLREFNHSPRFYRMMDEALPDWRERKSSLECFSR